MNDTINEIGSNSNNNIQAGGDVIIGIIPEKTVKIVDTKLFLIILFGCGLIALSIVELLVFLNIECYKIIGDLILYIIFPLVTFLLSHIFNYDLLYIYKDKMFLAGNEIKFSTKFEFNIKDKKIIYIHNQESKIIEFLYRKDLIYLKDKIDAYLENHSDS